MRRYIVIALATLAFQTPLLAQVAKQVEVTKDFAPEVGTSVKKLEITPSGVDTTSLRPEIEYNVVSNPSASQLGTRKFTPASVTYWEYKKKYPFYVKAGLGYPLHSVADVYATTHRADVGYLTGYVHHYGQYARMRYDDIATNQRHKSKIATQMENKVGVMGGKYFGRYTLSGDVFYRANTYNRFPLYDETFTRRKIDFEDVSLSLSFGDSFADYKHLNFKVYAAADYYHDKSQNFVAGDKYRQIDVKAGGSLAREISKRSAFSLDVDYRGYYGVKSLSSYRNSIAQLSLMYHYRSGGMLDMKLGAKVAYDNNPADAKKQHRVHAFPYLALSLNINDKGSFVPYIEVDGELQNNSYYSLVRQNPYVAILGSGVGLMQGDVALPNTALYNVRFGLSGHTTNSKFAYRFYANMSFMLNALYWYNVNQIFFNAESANRNVWSLCAALDYKPISQLLLTAEVKGALYTNFTDNVIADALPPVEATLSVRYTHRKFTLGASGRLYGPTKWTYERNMQLFDETSAFPVYRNTITVPTAVDLRVYADWHATRNCTVFIEGNNLLDMPIYRWVFYRELGASFTAGVKVQF